MCKNLETYLFGFFCYFCFMPSFRTLTDPWSCPRKEKERALDSLYSSHGIQPWQGRAWSATIASCSFHWVCQGQKNLIFCGHFNVDTVELFLSICFITRHSEMNESSTQFCGMTQILGNNFFAWHKITFQGVSTENQAGKRTREESHEEYFCTFTCALLSSISPPLPFLPRHLASTAALSATASLRLLCSLALSHDNPNSASFDENVDVTLLLLRNCKLL